MMKQPFRLAATIYSMIRKTILLFSICFFVGIISVKAFDPPGPGTDPTGDPNNDPLGGGAPIGEGIGLLLVMAAAYTGKKVFYTNNDTKSNSDK